MLVKRWRDAFPAPTTVKALASYNQCFINQNQRYN